MRAALEADPAVEAVHHVHLWSLASDEPSLSAHVVLEGEVTLHEAQQRGEALKTMLAERFGIDHSPPSSGMPRLRRDPAAHPRRTSGGQGWRRCQALGWVKVSRP